MLFILTSELMLCMSFAAWIHLFSISGVLTSFSIKKEKYLNKMWKTHWKQGVKFQLEFTPKCWQPPKQLSAPKENIFFTKTCKIYLLHKMNSNLQLKQIQMYIILHFALWSSTTLITLNRSKQSKKDPFSQIFFIFFMTFSYFPIFNRTRCKNAQLFHPAHCV